MSKAKPDKILRVNLTTSEINSEKIPERWLNHYWREGIGVAYFYTELEPGNDALSPQNKPLFMIGLLQGVPQLT